MLKVLEPSGWLDPKHCVVRTTQVLWELITWQVPWGDMNAFQVCRACSSRW